MRNKLILTSVMTVVVLSCFIALACASTNQYVVTHSPDPAVVNTPITVKFWTDDPSVKKVTFQWYEPDGITLRFATGPVDLVPDGSGWSASSTQTPDKENTWLVYITGVNPDLSPIAQTRVTMLHDVPMFIPELPLIGTVGASIAMLGGLAYKMKRKKA